MTPISQLCTLTSDATVDEAVFLMLDHGISGAPVIDRKSGELLGIVSTYDFLQQEAGEGQLLPIQGTLEDVKAYLSQAKKVSIGLYYNIVDFYCPQYVTTDKILQFLFSINRFVRHK